MSNLRLALLLFSSLSLAGCGGGGPKDHPVASPADVAIGGIATGLPTGATLILTNGNTETLAVRANGSFSFVKKVPAGADYTVSIWGNSSGLACTLANGAGKADAGSGSISTINITCLPGAIAMINFFVGVTVSGLAPGNSVTLTNNGTDTLTATENGLHIFLNHYVKEQVYGNQPGGYNVAVQSNPKGQTCSLSGASGALGLGPEQTTDFVNITAVCK